MNCSRYLKRVLVLVCCIQLIASLGYAEELKYVMKTLNRISGTWYTLDGNVAYNISGSTINGKKIVDISGLAGGGSNFACTIHMQDSSTMRLSFTNAGYDKTELHQYMSTNGQSYRRSALPQYYETVGGIYLGMSENQLYALYGVPNFTQDSHGRKQLGYSELGLEIDIRDGMVTQITIYSYGDRAFDRSGLSAKNSPTAFRQAYGLNKDIGNYANDIGHNEYIWYSQLDNSVTLSLYWN